MIYLDNAATTRPHPAAIDAVLVGLRDDFGNPSSRHRPGIEARRAVDDARESIARYCGIDPQGVVFTSGGTEANQLAALGLPLRSGTTKILSTNAEHPSLAKPLAARRGAELIQAPIGRDGTLDLARAAELLDEKVGLVALFEGHNETGARNPVAAIVELVRARAPRALIHFDCVQA